MGPFFPHSKLLYLSGKSLQNLQAGAQLLAKHGLIEIAPGPMRLEGLEICTLGEISGMYAYL